MPYYVHPKTVTLDPDDYYRDYPYPAFTNRQDAHTELCRTLGSKEGMITFVNDARERQDWLRREQARFERGDYIPVPWCSDYYDHFVHLSLSHPDMVAYTPDAEHGYLHKQIRTTPGRYLTKFYGDTWAKATIDAHIDACKANHWTIRYATTPDDIEAVYRRGPTSCMSHDLDDYRSDVHPVQVYGDPYDLSVAYLGDDGKVSQRCIVWQERKIFSRIYGSGPLQALLVRAGFTAGCVKGARVRLIPQDGGYVMPYVDGIEQASVHSSGRYVVLDNSGPISTTETNGLSSEIADQDSCLWCNDLFDTDDLVNGYCGYCRDHTWQCDNCEHRYDTASYSIRQWITSIRSRYRTLCERCAPDEEVCIICNGSFYESNSFTPAQSRERTARNLCETCVDCYPHMVDCFIADHDAYDDRVHAACPTCAAETNDDSPVETEAECV